MCLGLLGSEEVNKTGSEACLERCGSSPEVRDRTHVGTRRAELLRLPTVTVVGKGVVTRGVT